MLVEMPREVVSGIANKLDSETLLILTYFKLRDCYFDNYISWKDWGDGESNPWLEEAKQYYAIRELLGVNDDNTKVNLDAINKLAKKIGKQS